MFRFPSPDRPIFFGKVTKKNSESLVKKQVLKLTSTRPCLINTNCLKLSWILHFCSLFRHLVVLFLLYDLVPSDYERKDHVTKLSYLAAQPLLALRTLHVFIFFLPDRPTDPPSRERGRWETKQFIGMA